MVDREWLNFCDRVADLKDDNDAPMTATWLGVAIGSFLSSLTTSILIPTTSKSWSELVLALFVFLTVGSAAAVIYCGMRYRGERERFGNRVLRLEGHMRQIVKNSHRSYRGIGDENTVHEYAALDSEQPTQDAR